MCFEGPSIYQPLFSQHIEASPSVLGTDCVLRIEKWLSKSPGLTQGMMCLFHFQELFSDGPEMSVLETLGHFRGKSVKLPQVFVTCGMDTVSPSKSQGFSDRFVVLDIDSCAVPVKVCTKDAELSVNLFMYSKRYLISLNCVEFLRLVVL